MSHQIYFSIVAVELFYLPCRKTNSSRPKKIVQMIGIGCSRNGSNPRLARKHPYKRELRGGNAFTFCPSLHQIHQRHVVFQCFRLELRQVPASVVSGKGTVFVNGSGKKGTSQRTIRHKAYTQFFERREDFCLLYTSDAADE